MEKKSIYMKVSVHWIKAAIIEGLKDKSIDLNKDSLRLISDKLKLGKQSPQKVKHHIETLVNMGAIQKIDGQYVFENN